MYRFTKLVNVLAARLLMIAVVFVIAASPALAGMKEVKSVQTISITEPLEIKATGTGDQESASVSSSCKQRLCLDPMLSLTKVLPPVHRNASLIDLDLSRHAMQGQRPKIQSPPPKHLVF